MQNRLSLLFSKGLSLVVITGLLLSGGMISQASASALGSVADALHEELVHITLGEGAQGSHHGEKELPSSLLIDHTRSDHIETDHTHPDQSRSDHGQSGHRHGHHSQDHSHAFGILMQPCAQGLPPYDGVAYDRRNDDADRAAIMRLDRPPINFLS